MVYWEQLLALGPKLPRVITVEFILYIKDVTRKIRPSNFGLTRNRGRPAHTKTNSRNKVLGKFCMMENCGKS